jgi:alkylated DNA repair dioxygenase AlkB
MTRAYQPSMLDLTAGPATTLGPLPGRLTRHRLTAGAWVDVLPGWLHGSDAVFETLLGIDWRADRRQMYDSVVDVPRLLRWFGEGEPLPHPALTEAKVALSAHYAGELGEPFVTAGMCLYRDGRDSVAWHGDTLGRSARQDTMVAILSLGSPRNLMLRPRDRNPEPPQNPNLEQLPQDRNPEQLPQNRNPEQPQQDRDPEQHPQAGRQGRPRAGGPETLKFPLGHGDLIVMGGSCQRTWEHAIPKTARPVGPRISVQFRPHDVA